ncbi:MAG: dolichol-P-mannose synthesis [Cirrosporium novae-zelandiae]|nr:MAG: dolichol-P-mannose synthesis [Cirrosporium novae-zelandiae]
MSVRQRKPSAPEPLDHQHSFPYSTLDKASEALNSAEQTVEKHFTLTWHQLPSWLQDNHFIRNGYRQPSNSYLKSWRSLGYLHNESVNIWSHLLGAVAFSITSFVLYRILKPRFYTATASDVIAFGCFFLGAALCMGLSATYHTISNHSPQVAGFANQLDYVGIVFLIAGSFVPSVALYVLSLLNSKRQNGDLSARARIPERWSPGSFDIWGSSHQIFHVLVVAAATTQLKGILQGFDYNHSVFLGDNGRGSHCSNKWASELLSGTAYRASGHHNGSGQGIGAETARLFASESAKIVIQDVDAKKAEDVAKNINESGGEAVVSAGDVLDPAYSEGLIKAAASFGNGKIHITVNNAGFTWDGVIHKMTDKQWDTILALHCTAPFRLIRAAAPYFRVRDCEPRVIINISSTFGLHAKEWGPRFGDKVALGIPGRGIEGGKEGEEGYKEIPLRRVGSATEAARAVLAVASPLFNYVNGQMISVTGGRNMGSRDSTSLGSNLDWEIIVVDDASPDGTLEIAKQLQNLYTPERIILKPRSGKLGLGTAYVHALQFAKGDFIIIMDADFSHHPKFIPQMVETQKKTGCDIVTGTRYRSGGGVYGWNAYRKLTSKGANLIASTVLLPQGVSDLTGSFRLYKKEALSRAIASTESKGYSFQMELIIRALALGYTVKEVPITFVDRVFGDSKLGGDEIVGFLKAVLSLWVKV